jgi:hypothetical protein
MLSMTITPTSTPAAALMARRNRAGAVGIARQQQHMFITDIGTVDSGIGEHDAEPVRDDQRAGTDTGRPKGSARRCGILRGLLSERDGARRRRDRAQIDRAAFGLGHDLLGHHQHIAGGELAIGAFQRRRMIAARSSPAAIKGMPSSGVRTRVGRALNRKLPYPP